MRLNLFALLVAAGGRVTRLGLLPFVAVGVAALSACGADSTTDGGTAGTFGSAGVGTTAGSFGGTSGTTAGAVATAGNGTGVGAAGTLPVAGTGAAGVSAGSGAGVGAAGEGAAGAAGVGAAGTGAAGDCALPGATDHFSFFVTSLAGIRRLSGSQDGFGGDLRFGKADGLAGADEICRQLAESSAAGAGCKTWRAFLSVTKDGSGNPVNAKDRIGAGPWYDRTGRLVANNQTELLADWPTTASADIKFDLPNEFGVPNHDPDGTGQVDNHNTISGSKSGGLLHSADWAYTCHDWTSKVGTDGTPAIGFSWKGGAGAMFGAGWYYGNITEGGCAPQVNLLDSMNFSDRGIGARGGYGGFYCLANEP